MLEFIKVLLEITTVSDIVRTKHIFYLQYIVTVILCCVVIARSVDLLGHFNSFFSWKFMLLSPNLFIT